MEKYWNADVHAYAPTELTFTYEENIIRTIGDFSFPINHRVLPNVSTLLLILSSKTTMS